MFIKSCTIISVQKMVSTNVKGVSTKTDITVSKPTHLHVASQGRINLGYYADAPRRSLVYFLRRRRIKINKRCLCARVRVRVCVHARVRERERESCDTHSDNLAASSPGV